ncbi:MAG: chromosome segregation protein, partial [Pseudohongiellaceae bacterium]
MRLTSIEIQGFKSFADRTILHLPPGLTAIVGPNGCGKSNVIDAVKWALGEQRASALRGKDMLDVIFKGNGARAQRNFAEVSLVFDNTDGVLPVDYTEVVLTRRLYRSGESEYMLNRQAARLKDIRDLLLDTGLGASAYSVMEQGRIDAVLSANALERRRIFEEAAGISRYRARRRESELKLARTEQNLLRLGDVLEELEKRQRSLKVQAGRARTYVESRDRSRQLRSLYFTHQWHDLGGTMQQQGSDESTLSEAEKGARSELESSRQSVTALQEKLSTVRQVVDETAESFRQATGEVEALGERQSSLRERIADVANRRELLEGRVQSLQQALEARRLEVAGVGKRLEEVSAEASRWESSVAECSTAHRAALEELQQWRKSTEERREAALARLGTLTEYRNRRSAAASRHAGLTASRDRLDEQIVVLDVQLESQAELQKELFAKARALDKEVEVTGAELSSRLDQEQRLGSELQGLDSQLQDVREKLAAATSRRGTLEELIQRRDGVAPGAVSLLESSVDGLHGLLIDHVDVPLGLAQAVEVALGATTQALVVADRASGLSALEHLASVKGGRVALIPADSMIARQGAAPGERLLDQLHVTDHHSMFEGLLSHVRLVADRAALAEIQADGVTVWVTPAGELLDEHGVLRGGAAGKEGGLVARRAELAELVVACTSLEKNTALLSAQRGEIHEQLRQAREFVGESRKALREFETDRERASEAERQGAARHQGLQRDRGLRIADLEKLAVELTAVAATLAEAIRLEGELEASVAADRAEEAREELRQRELQATFAAAQEALAAARLEHSARRERQDALESERRQVQRSADERGQEAKNAVGELDGLSGLREGFEEKLTVLDERCSLLTGQRDARAEALYKVRESSNTVGGE